MVDFGDKRLKGPFTEAQILRDDYLGGPTPEAAAPGELREEEWEVDPVQPPRWEAGYAKVGQVYTDEQGRLARVVDCNANNTHLEGQFSARWGNCPQNISKLMRRKTPVTPEAGRPWRCSDDGVTSSPCNHGDACRWANTNRRFRDGTSWTPERMVATANAVQQPEAAPKTCAPPSWEEHLGQETVIRQQMESKNLVYSIRDEPIDEAYQIKPVDHSQHPAQSHSILAGGVWGLRASK
jgi:hypothetical protein